MARKKRAKRAHTVDRGARWLLFAALLLAGALSLYEHRGVVRATAAGVVRRACATQASRPAPAVPAVVAPEPTPVTATEIVGPVDESSLAPSLNVIRQAPEGSAVNLYINSPGGNGIAMLAWLDEVDRIKAAKGTRLHCTTGSLLASAASIIFEAACDRRVLSASTVVLFHGVGSMAAGKAGDVEDAARLMRTLDWSVATRVAPKLHMGVQQYLDWIDRRDRWLTAQELLDLGGADALK